MLYSLNITLNIMKVKKSNVKNLKGKKHRRSFLFINTLLNLSVRAPVVCLSIFGIQAVRNR